MTRKPWSRDEILVAFNVYCRTPFGRLHARNPEIVELATRLDRTPAALAMKCCNLAGLDPAQRERGIVGLAKASRFDREIWDEFQQRPEEIGFESEQVLAGLTDRPPRAATTVVWEDAEGLDRETLTRVRVNQHLFRAMILAGYGGACAVCRLPVPGLLVASHIVPWSADRSLRMNPHNGLCLCSLHDRAFDCGILAIARDYSVAIHPRASSLAANEAAARFLFAFSGTAIQQPERWPPDPLLLERHAEIADARVTSALGEMR
ncbi:MAG TPA: HNH endonuclease signature motif containing protein [Pirellulales bacterium]|nr:HNH endonuclease signature motif containing protein [Pirellulales bacterium]